MLSISVSEQVQFKNKKCGKITVLPVTVEFGKFIGNESLNGKSKRYINGKSTRDADSQLTAPAELLHAVAALYHTYLPDSNLAAIYRTLCREGSRTLLFLRDGAEILEDWKTHGGTDNEHNKNSEEVNNNNKAETKKTDINKNRNKYENEKSCDPIGDTKDISPTSSSSLSSPEAIITNESLSPTSNTTTQDEGIDTVDNASIISSDNGSVDDYHSASWSISSNQNYKRSITDIFAECNLRNSRHLKLNGISLADRQKFMPTHQSRPSSRNSNCSDSHCKEFVNYNSNAISDVFDDSDDEADNESIEEEDDCNNLERGMEIFLRSVANRKNQRREALLSASMSQIGIEHRLIACTTFHKNYRLPGTKLVCVPFLVVRRRYRHAGIGKFLLKRLKRPSLVGPYDALVVNANSSNTDFFRKNDFTDDLILNSRFTEAVIDEDDLPNVTNSNTNRGSYNCQMCYLPSFDGHYPPMPGTDEWNRPEVISAIDSEIENWRQKSLEAYQAQWTCITRLQQEVIKLRSHLKRQEYSVHKLRRENQNLQKMLLQSETQSTLALIDAWEKETASFR